MTGEKDLQQLLASMSPVLMKGEFVFCTFKGARYGDFAHLEPLASMSESEGLTLVISKSTADDNEYEYDAVFKGITLLIHSSLEAVGLTAAFSTKLTEHGISANVIAGYYHDHIFVPTVLADKAIEVLESFTK